MRGKSGTVRITHESFEDDLAEVDEMEMSKINDDVVKKLLMYDTNGQRNDKNEVEGPNVK